MPIMVWVAFLVERVINIADINFIYLFSAYFFEF